LPRYPRLRGSSSWQLAINRDDIITFLMVFLIQATQNRDTLALQIKLSELILALEELATNLLRWSGSPDRRTPVQA
jgi:low affinity Fe/Cu permease